MVVSSFAATAEMTFGGGLPVPRLATAEATFGGGRRKLFPVLNLFLPNMEVFLHLNVVPRVSIHQGSHSDWKTWKTWKNGKAFSSQGKVREF